MPPLWEQVSVFNYAMVAVMRWSLIAQCCCRRGGKLVPMAIDAVKRGCNNQTWLQTTWDMLTWLPCTIMVGMN